MAQTARKAITPSLTTRERIAQTVRALQARQHWTDAELGSRSGMSGANIQTKTTCRSDFKPDQLEAVADAFGVPVHVLFMLSDDALVWAITNKAAPPERRQTVIPLRGKEKRTAAGGRNLPWSFDEGGSAQPGPLMVSPRYLPATGIATSHANMPDLVNGLSVAR